MQQTRLVGSSLAAVAIAIGASFSSVSCSAGPPGRSPPVLVEGEAHPGAGAVGAGAVGATASGASGATSAPEAGPDDDCGAAPEPVATPACTALAQCCSRFDLQDPAQAWCQESLVQATGPDACGRLLTFWGC